MIKDLIKTIFLILVIIINFTLVPAQAQLVLEWAANYTSVADSSDVSKDMVLDNYGNVYITGYCWNDADQRDVRTIKYDSSGIEIWSVAFNLGPGSWDEGVALNLDNLENLYVGGFTRTIGGDFDYLIVKYDSSGNEIWSVTYNSPLGGDDYLTSLIVDPLGNIVVTGYSADSIGNTDYATVKYNSSGQQLWAQRYNGDGSGYDKAWALASDSQGYVYVTGSSDNIPGTTIEFDYLTIKYDPDGNQLWSAAWDGFGNPQDNGLGIVVDTEGYVYVTGTSNGDYTTIQYDSEGTEEWFQIYNGPAGLKDKAFAISLDNLGNIIVTGGSRGSDSTYDFATIKYTAEGTELWLKRYSGPGLFDDEAKSMAVDVNNNIYVSGYSWGSSCDFATVKYTSEGIEDWIVRYDGENQDYDYPNSTRVDANGKIYVTGYTTAISTGLNMTTLCYSPVENDMDIELTYNSGSPLPPEGGNIIFDVLIINDGITILNFDAWVDVSYQGSISRTFIQRSFESFQPAWIIEREDIILTVPASFPAGNYLVSGKVGRQPDEIWNQSDFAFAKLGDQTTTGFEPKFPSEMQETLTSNNDQSVKHAYHDMLLYNFPDPFNATTTISFSIPVPGEVSLLIYDIRGREIVNLMKGFKPAGFHNIKFEGSSLASGIYFARLDVGEFHRIHKLMLLK